MEDEAATQEKHKGLIVFFVIKSMSTPVASKGRIGSMKKYKVKQESRKFPAAMTPDMAIDSILKEFGDKPGDGRHSVTIGHSYAEIVSWRYY
jgi:hypothetical protein